VWVMAVFSIFNALVCGRPVRFREKWSHDIYYTSHIITSGRLIRTGGRSMYIIVDHKQLQLYTAQATGTRYMIKLKISSSK